ncbi:hypothetical protein Ga0466249_004409 [Sporomusaceae bacterium BoRhaA]|uniref:DUF2325 domain-containing protein n=1 Tax=Pelorhabdus rhamnosifermentans TaxID=2772457 RepID=UPI0035E4347B|nr:hypothetical protein [Pelorhabdus rhamnosifermentans]
MMNVIIIGADHLGSIEKNLTTYGATQIAHVSGRSTLDRKIAIPQTASLVVILTDYVNHGTAKHVKAAAKAQGIPAVFTKRSWSWLERQLIKSGFKRQQPELV